MASIDYKYNEAEIVADLMEYIDKTYSGHYSQNRFQATEFIIDAGHGDGFCIGNIIKYAQRYGKKNGKGRPHEDYPLFYHVPTRQSLPYIRN